MRLDMDAWQIMYLSTDFALDSPSNPNASSQNRAPDVGE
jgi:hypothetical protein